MGVEPDSGSGLGFGYLPEGAASAADQALSEEAVRRAALLAWKALPSSGRREAMQFGRRGKLHPDPTVRDAFRGWALYQRDAQISTGLVFASVGVVLFTVGAAVGAPTASMLWLLGTTGFLLVNTILVMRRAARTALNPSSPIATPTDSERLDRVAGFRPAWFARVALMVFCLPVGGICAIGAFATALAGDGSPAVAGIVGVIGVLMLAAGVQAARLHWRARRNG